jgi:ribosomal protein S18 acetylase RimI-like enzyme
VSRPDIDLRRASADDAEAIARLHAASWRAAYRGFYRDAYLDGNIVEERTEVWRQRLLSPSENQFVLLAAAADGLLGFVCAYGNDDERWGTLVDNLHVLPDHQGRGLGRRLLAASAACSSERYPDALLHLWVLEGNAKARRFYERLGGQPEETAVSEPPGGGSITGVRYVWRSLEPLLAHAGSGAPGRMRPP